MKTNISVCFIVSLTLLILLKCSPIISAKLPSIQIKTNKTVYLESEPVWTEIEVNIDKDINVDLTPFISPFCGNVKFILLNELNDTLKGNYCVSASSLYSGFSYHLEHYFIINNILDIYEKIEDFKNSQLVRRFKLLPGSYKLTAIMSLRINKKFENYFSNKVEFKVEKPAGIEDENHKMLIDLQNYAVNGDSDYNLRFEGLCKKVNDFKDRNPYSVYLDKAVNEVFSWGNFIQNFKDTISNYIFNRLNENPENYYNEEYVASLGYLYKGNEVSLKDTLTQISKSKPGTLLQNIIDNYIEEKEATEQFELKRKSNGIKK